METKDAFLADVYWLWGKLVDFWFVILNYRYSFYILLVLLIIGSLVISRIKNRYFSSLVSFIYFLIVVAFIGFILTKGYQMLKDYNAKHPSSEIKFDLPTAIPNTTTKPKATSTYQPPAATQAPQTQKQLYYSVDCSSCWTQGCASNGYNYGGYDSYQYSFYYSLCKSCSCNSFTARSFWK